MNCDGVLGEALEGRTYELAALAQPAFGDLLVEVLAHCDELPVLEYAVAPKLDLVPGREPLEHLLADPVEDVDAGAGQDKRPRVRVLAGRRARRVHHRVHPGLHERLGRYPVEVLVVEDRDGDAVRVAAGSPWSSSRGSPCPNSRNSPSDPFRPRPSLDLISHQPGAPMRAPARPRPRGPRASARAPGGAPRPRPAGSGLSCARRSPPSETTTCESASEAIWGRWVMVRTWLRSPSSRSFAPTAVAVSPPMPASTSSKT